MASNDLIVVLHHETGEICLFGEGAPFQTTGESNQVSSTHVVAQRILSWVLNLSFHRNGWWVASPKVPVHEHPVLWLQKDVRALISFQRLAQVHTEDRKSTRLNS